MLNRESLEPFARKQQTDVGNVIREYCQHVFLSALYQQAGSERLLFKGGTALRIIFGSPRYSQDLDFTGTGISQRDVENLFAATLVEIERSGIQVNISEGKKTPGGYLGIAVFSVHDQNIEMHVEVSLRISARSSNRKLSRSWGRVERLRMHDGAGLTNTSDPRCEERSDGAL